jgi:DNA-binding MarR family transcriptional regulator
VANNITGENGEYITTGTFDEESGYFEAEEYNEINNDMYKEETTMENTNNTFTFTQDGITYESTPNGRFYGTVNGKKTRIGKAAFECEFKRYIKGQAEEDQFEEKMEQFEEDVTTEELKEIEKEIKKEAKKAAAKKEKKPSKPKAKKIQIGGMEFDHKGVKIILTPKQVDFIKHLPDTSFWENGVQSEIWIDCLCDEIGGQFAARPMTVGAMISTLCEKGLGMRATNRRENRKCVSFQLTELGQKIAKNLGLE